MALFYPPFIEWEVTPTCNHNCIHCYNYWRSEKTQDAAKQFDNSTNAAYYNRLARRIVENKPVSVAITGGEPLIVFNKIQEAIDILLNAGIVVTINSNAVLMDKEKASFFADRKIDFFISLPCANAEVNDRITGVTGSLQKTSNAIINMKKSGINVATNTVISKLNFPYLYETGQYVHDVLGQKYFCATRACLPSNAQSGFRDQILSKAEFIKMLEIMIQIKNDFNMKIDTARAHALCSLDNNEIIRHFWGKRRCAGGKLSFVVAFNGDIKACAMDTKSYGNIMTDSFRDAIAKMKEWQTIEFLPDECQNCHHKYSCSGGCRIDALTTYGDFRKLDPLSDPSILDRIELSYAMPEADVNFNKAFRLADNLIVVEENNCVRISNHDKFQFLNEAAYRILSEMRTFYLSDFSKKFSIDDDKAKRSIISLLATGVLTYC